MSVTYRSGWSQSVPTSTHRSTKTTTTTC